jgi:FHS family Na+ dependent glucose MFS transporter 1
MLPVAVWIFSLSSPASQRVSGDQRTEQINYPLIVLIGIFFLLYVGAEVGFGGWIFTYVITLELMNETLAAYVTSAFWGALTVGRLLSIPFAARFRPVVILFSSLAGCLLSMGIMLLWLNSLVAIWVGAFGLGFSMATIFPTMLSFSGRRMTITGQVTGWFFVGASLGGMSLPWVIGQFFESIGPHVMMFAILAALIGAVIVLTGVFFAFKDNQTV